MKQSFLKFNGKKLLAATFISASVLLSSYNANAAATFKNIEIITGSNSSIQFAGSTSDALLFKLHVDNEKGDNFTVTIKNQDGLILFSKAFNDVNFDKQFKLLKADQEGDKYTFTVSSSNKNLEETFVVNSVVRTVDDVTINKM